MQSCVDGAISCGTEKTDGVLFGIILGQTDCVVLFEEASVMEEKFSAYQDRLSLANKLARLAWQCVSLLAFRPFVGPLFKRWRNLVLRVFGARLGRHCVIASSAKIWAPWNLTLRDYVAIGPCADVYNVAPIVMGSNITISQESYLCTASHDISKIKKPLVTARIEIQDSAWVCARAIVLPGVKLGEGAIIAAGAVVTKDVAPWTVVGGNPARVIKKRVLS